MNVTRPPNPNIATAVGNGATITVEEWVNGIDNTAGKQAVTYPTP